MATELLDPIPPGEILLEEFMRPLGISINALARDIHVPPNRISEIVNGKRGDYGGYGIAVRKVFRCVAGAVAGITGRPRYPCGKTHSMA